MPKCYMAIFRDLSWSGEAVSFCHDETKMERQEGESLIWFLFISRALWQPAELLFYAVRLRRPCQDSLQTTHFFIYLGNVCLVASEARPQKDFFESNLVVCLLWFHFIWNLAEEEWIKTFLVCVLFSVHKRDRIWINYDSMWN